MEARTTSRSQLLLLYLTLSIINLALIVTSYNHNCLELFFIFFSNHGKKKENEKNKCFCFFLIFWFKIMLTYFSIDFFVCKIVSENILQTYFLLRPSTEENDCIIQIRNRKLITWCPEIDNRKTSMEIEHQSKGISCELT